MQDDEAIATVVHTMLDQYAVENATLIQNRVAVQIELETRSLESMLEKSSSKEITKSDMDK